MRRALIPFILSALCNAVGMSLPKDNTIENYTRISAKFASGVGWGVMVGRGLSIMSRTLRLRHAS
jgi:hypothetical protein